MIKKWPLHPKPYEYELLYRWIERLAKVYEISYHSFCKNVLGLTTQEISDLHKSLPEKALVILSNGTTVPVNDLRCRDLHSTFKRLQHEVNEIIAKDPDALMPFINQSVFKP